MKILFTLLLTLLPVMSYGLPEPYKRTLQGNMNVLLSQKTAYVWGGVGGIKNGVIGLDCSGLIYYLYKKSGIPVKRSTAFRMRHGLDGWIGDDIVLNDAEAHDLPFWTWKGQEAKRPFGHVGIFYEGSRSKLLEAMHSSSSKNGVVVQQLLGSLLRDLKAIRRITIGDKKQNGTTGKK